MYTKIAIKTTTVIDLNASAYWDIINSYIVKGNEEWGMESVESISSVCLIGSISSIPIHIGETSVEFGYVHKIAIKNKQLQSF